MNDIAEVRPRIGVAKLRCELQPPDGLGAIHGAADPFIQHNTRSRLRYALDASAGWMAPAQMFVFRLEGGAGVRLFPHNVLGLRAFLGRGQGGRPSEQEQGLWVTYELTRN